MAVVIIMENSRSAIFALYHVLCRFSSREEPLSIEKIRALLKQEHSLSLTRTTLRSYLKALDDFGIRIAAVPGGRYLAGRQFEESEVYLLSNAVHSAHFISSAQSEALIRKLLATQSRSFEKQFHESVHLENRRKINSPALLQNIETLLSAIQQRKAVTFAYLHYDLRKQLVPKRQKPYHVYPYFMVMENDNVYLLCKSPSHPEHFAHYRVDKITDINMTAETIPPLDDDMDPYTYTAQRKFMYSDAVDTITLRCHLRMLDDLIDQFGSALSLAPADDEHFLAHLHASRQGIVYLALQYARYCEILQPADLRQEVISILQDTLKRYER